MSGEGKIVRVGSRNSQVFNTRKFEPSQAAFNSVFNAPQKTLLELANRSEDIKIRFSTFGVIKLMTEVMSSPDNNAWRRREVTVEHDNTKMRLKLWGEQSSLVDDNFLGQHAVIKNIAIDRYKGSNTLASTDQTSIELNNGVVATKIFTVAGWIDTEGLRVCDEENNEFKLASSITEEDLEAMVGVKVRCQVLNNCIQDMKSFDGDLDSDSDNDEHDDDE